MELHQILWLTNIEEQLLRFPFDQAELDVLFFLLCFIFFGISPKHAGHLT